MDFNLLFEHQQYLAIYLIGCGVFGHGAVIGVIIERKWPQVKREIKPRRNNNWKNK